MRKTLFFILLLTSFISKAQIDSSLSHWQEAQYIYGDDSLSSLIISELQYPDSAMKYSINGEVILYLIVTDSGTIDSIGFSSKKIGFGLEEEAKRLILLTDGDWQRNGVEDHVGEIAYVSIYFRLPTNDTVAFNSEMKRPFVSNGYQGFNHFLLENLEYPRSAIDYEVQGTVVIQFVVCKDGSVCELKVLSKKLGFGLEEAALKVVQQTSGLWVPATMNGKAVNVRYQLPINFQLY